ncbi:MAG: IPT/TIG domain-containing protein, partial [Candidatus Paceibacterota bacterium]
MTMDAVTPSSGPIGLPVAITGSGFGNYRAGYTRVLLGDTTAPVTSWSDTQIKFTAPGTLAVGNYDLAIERELNGGLMTSLPVSWTVTVPEILTITPVNAPMAGPVTLTGNSFGNYRAGYTVVLMGGATAQVTSWTDTQIKVRTPYLMPGNYGVQVTRSLNGGLSESSTAYINITWPVVSSMTPVSGQG